MSDIRTYDPIADNNQQPVPDGWPENQAPSSVNNCARENMAASARLFGDTSGRLASTGSAGAYAVTTGQSIPAYEQGITLAFIANHTNTAAPTLNMNALGARPIYGPEQKPLVPGDLQLNEIVVVSYQPIGAYWQLLSHPATAADKYASINAQTGTAYTLVASDNGGVVTLNNAAEITLTAPAMSTLIDGFQCSIIQRGAGQVVLAKDAGDTLESKNNATKLRGQHSIATLVKHEATVLGFYGDITA